MSIHVWTVPFLLLGLVIRAVQLLGLVVRGGLRRIRGRYRSGYALVDLEVEPGAMARGTDDPRGHLAVARDPVFLPLPEGTRVARVRNVQGVRTSFREDGRRWRASGAEVLEFLPAWVVLGPAGDGAVDVVEAATSVDLTRLETARSAGDLRDFGSLLHLDPWREALFISIRAVAQASFHARPVEHIAGGKELVDGEFERRLAQYPTGGWDAALRATIAAAVAAALVDELLPDAVVTLTADWLALVGLESDASWRPAPGPAKRAVSGARRFVHWIDRHPNVAVAITIAILFPVFLADPLVALALMLAVPFIVAPFAVAQIYIRRRRVGRRRWAPTGDVGSRPPEVQVLRRAMAALEVGSHPVLVHHLGRLLDRATVWITPDWPPHADPSRWLAWKRRFGEPLPVALIRTDAGELVFPCYSSAPARRKRLRTSQLQRAIPVAFRDALALATSLGADVMVVDPGLQPSIAIGKAAFTSPESAVPPAAEVGERHP